MATKVITAKPGGRVRRTIVKETTDQRIFKLRQILGLDHKWENLKFNIKLAETKP